MMWRLLAVLIVLTTVASSTSAQTTYNQTATAGVKNNFSCDGTTSDLTLNRLDLKMIQSGLAGGGYGGRQVGASSTQIAYSLLSPSNITVGASGTWTVNFHINSGVGGVTWDGVCIFWVDSAGTTNKGSIGTATGLAIPLNIGVLSTTVSGSSFSPLAGDKVYIEYVLINSTGGTGFFGISSDSTITAPITSPTPTISSIALTPLNVNIATGGTKQLVATATYNTGDQIDVSTTAAWSSLNGAIATTNSTGLVTGVLKGSTTIQAVQSSITGSSPVTVTGLDPYGGDAAHACVGILKNGSAIPGATGFFYIYKDTSIKHWMFCDPSGNRFWLVGMQVLDGGNAGYTAIANPKDASVSGGRFSQNLIRLQALGFNTVGYAAITGYWPIALNGSNGFVTTVPMPFLYNMSPAHQGGMKDLIANAPPAYDTFGGYRGYVFPDIFDAAWNTAVQQYATTLQSTGSPFTGGAAAADASPWIIGTLEDDSDYVVSWNGGGTHVGYMTAMMPPYMWFQNAPHARGAQVFSSPTAQIKVNLQNYLCGTKYANVTALNAAWGSSYSTCGSSATTVTGETIGTGDGAATSFSHTFAHGIVDDASIGISVGGVLQAGDTPWFNSGACSIATGRACVQAASGNINGGSVTYASGGTACGGQPAPCITVTFSVAPANGVAITATYQYNGWPKATNGGTGLLDEDGTSSWFPNTINPSDPPLDTVGGDLNVFLGLISKQYHSVIYSWVKAQFPHHLLFSANPLSPNTRKVILANAAPYLDAFFMGAMQQVNAGGEASAISMYNTLGLPVYAYELNSSQPDSPYSATPCPIHPEQCFPTQAAKGVAYQNDLTNYFKTFTGADGYGFMLGVDMWQFTDNTSELGAYGIVSLKDNIYGYIPGFPSKTETQSISITDPYSFTTTPEAGNYGNFAGGVFCGNQAWLGVACNNPAAPGVSPGHLP